MNIEDKLTESKIYHRLIEEYDNDTKIFKVGVDNPTNVVVLLSNSNTFKIDRDLMFYLSNQREKYTFWFINKNEGTMYYLEFLSNNNWLESSFRRSDKEIIYFGKIVLNHKLEESAILSKLARIQ